MGAMSVAPVVGPGLPPSGFGAGPAGFGIPGFGPIAAQPPSTGPIDRIAAPFAYARVAHTIEQQRRMIITRCISLGITVLVLIVLQVWRLLHSRTISNEGFLFLWRGNIPNVIHFFSNKVNFSNFFLLIVCDHSLCFLNLNFNH